MEKEVFGDWRGALLDRLDGAGRFGCFKERFHCGMDVLVQEKAIKINQYPHFPLRMSSLVADHGGFEVVDSSNTLNDSLVHDVYLEGKVVTGLPYNLGTNLFDYTITVKLKSSNDSGNTIQVHVNRVLPKCSVTSDMLNIGRRIIIRNLLNDDEYSPCVACSINQIEYEHNNTSGGETNGEIKYIICSLNEIKSSDTSTDISLNTVRFKLPFNKVKAFQSIITGSDLVPWKLHQATYMLVHNPIASEDSHRSDVIREIKSSNFLPCINEKVEKILTTIKDACAGIVTDLHHINDGDISSIDEELARTYSFNNNNRELHAFSARRSADLNPNATMLLSNMFIKQATKRVREAFRSTSELLEALSLLSIVVQTISGKDIRDIQSDDLIACVQHNIDAVINSINETLIKLIYLLPTPYLVSCGDWASTYSCIFDVREILDSLANGLKSMLPDSTLDALCDTRDQYTMSLLSAQEAMLQAMGNFASTYLMDDVIRQDWNSTTTFRHGTKVTHGLMATFMSYYQMYHSLVDNCMGNCNYYNDVVLPLTLQLLTIIGTIFMETYGSVEVGTRVRAWQYAADCKYMLYNVRNILNTVLTNDLADYVVPTDWVSSQFVYSKDKMEHFASLQDAIVSESAKRTYASVSNLKGAEYMHELRTVVIDILIFTFIIGEKNGELVADSLTTSNCDVTDDVNILDLLQHVSGADTDQLRFNIDTKYINDVSVSPEVLKFRSSPYISVNKLIRNRCDMVDSGTTEPNELAGCGRLRTILSNSYESL